MKPHRFVIATLIVAACSSSSETSPPIEDSTVADAHDAVVDSPVVDANDANDSVVDSGAPSACGDVGFVGADGTAPAPCNCEAGTVCVQGTSTSGSYAFCTPILAECDGAPTCECMGQCVCEHSESVGCATVNDVGITCNTATSRRAFKRNIRYVDENQREILAKQALSIPLATYAYKTDAPGARARLGFIIDDQPDPSFAVDDDRTHVDVYGYTSMLLATVQQQQKEIAALEKRVEALEARQAKK